MVHLQRIVSFLGVCGKPFAIFFSARWLDSPYFSHVVRIMYLYVLKNVTACESHCSLPPNLEQRHGLKKKKITCGQNYRDQCTEMYRHLQKRTHQHQWEGRESSTSFLNPELVLTLFGVLCAQARERDANRLLVVVAMETGRDKRPQKWRNKMTCKD